MKEKLPINPSVLRWARETAGVPLEDVARKLGRKSITVETIAAWETGEGSPSYAQLEELAYQIYKRPLALFFFPAPPLEETPRQAFRTLPEHEIELLSSRLRYIIRQAKTMQINLAELYEGNNLSQRQIVSDLKFAPEMAISEIVAAVRKYLNINLKEQCKWHSAEEAFKGWRKAFEECGVFVFKEAFKDDSYSGFCLYDERFPLIYVNNSKSDTRQVFTLFHELPHLLFRTGGVDKPLEDYIQFLQGDNRRIEVICNRFAGAFLVPDDDFDQNIKTVSINDDTIVELAKRYCVSREVILRKFYDRKLVSSHFYEQKVEEWNKKVEEWNKGKVKEGTTGNYYRTKGAYLGESYIELVFSHLYQNRISVKQLADYLGVKEKNVPGMEELLFTKGGGA